MKTLKKPATRRQEILDIAAAGFARSGFDGYSVREIAQEADILSGSLYHHFASKNEMVIEIMDRYWQSLFNAYSQVLASNKPPDQTLTDLIIASLTVAEECPNEVRILHQDWHYLDAVLPNLSDNMSQIEHTFTDILKMGIDQKIIRNDLNPRIAYRTIMGAIAWVTRWYNTNGSLTMKQIGKTQATLWVNGLLSDNKNS